MAGDGAVAKLIDKTAALLVVGITAKTPNINYVPRSEIEKGVETAAYTGTDIAVSEGKGPKCSAEEGV